MSMAFKVLELGVGTWKLTEMRLTSMRSSIMILAGRESTTDASWKRLGEPRDAIGAHLGGNRRCLAEFQRHLGSPRRRPGDQTDTDMRFKMHVESFRQMSWEPITGSLLLEIVCCNDIDV